MGQAPQPTTNICATMWATYLAWPGRMMSNANWDLPGPDRHKDRDGEMLIHSETATNWAQKQGNYLIIIPPSWPTNKYYPGDVPLIYVASVKCPLSAQAQLKIRVLPILIFTFKCQFNKKFNKLN